MGGFMNQVSGRFGTILGGARNYARGRYSVAAGYSANANQDYTMAVGLTGKQCDVDTPNTFGVCTETLTINGVDIVQTLEYMTVRRGLGAGAAAAAAEEEEEASVEKIASKLQEQDKLIAEQHKLNDAQDAAALQSEKAVAELHELLGAVRKARAAVAAKMSA
jgi:hypothetical protein